VVNEEELLWRYECLTLAGWPHSHAEVLANLSDVDLHEACTLLDRGCDVEIAFRLVLPLDLPLPRRKDPGLDGPIVRVPVESPYDVARQLGITIRTIE